MNMITAGKMVQVPEMALGCMRIGEMEKSDLSNLIATSFENGINFYEHADIYGEGKCEEAFGEACQLPRESILIQSKCGIRKGFFDFSKEHILNSVEGSLKRLKTDYLDFLVLHRPDTLFEPEEVAEAFDKLFEQGKVRYFGVSNQNSMQIELLQKYVQQKLIFNQLQFSIMHTPLIDEGFHVNMKNSEATVGDGSVLEYCRLKDITIQAWSPFQYGFFQGVFLDNPKFPLLNRTINDIAIKKGVSNSGIAAAWILRHPARMQVILGTTSSNRLKEICKAKDIELSREEWYEIYRAAGNVLP